MLTTQDPFSHSKKPFILWRPIVYFWRWMFPPTLADLDRQSKAARRVAGTLLVLSVIGILATTYYYGRNVRSLYKSYRSEKLVAQSREFEAEGKYYDALDAANQAYLMDAENTNAIRNIARFATLMKRNEARYFWNKLRDSGELSPQDEAWEIRALFHLGEDKVAAERIQQLAATSTTLTRDLIEVADQVLAKVGRRVELIELLRRFTQEYPEDIESKLALAIRLTEVKTPTTQREGLDLLWSLAEQPNETGLSALKQLNQTEFNNESDLERYRNLLQKHESISQEQIVAMLRKEAEVYPDRKLQLVEKAVRDSQKLERDDLLPLSRWLAIESQRDEAYAELLLKLVSEEQALAFVPLLENYLNALTSLKRFDDLERVITDPKTHLTQAQKAFYNMHLSYIKGVRGEPLDDKIIEALIAAQKERRGDVVMRIAQYAEMRQRNTTSETAYRAAVTFRALEQEAFEGLLRLTYRNGNSKGFMEAAEDTARRWPENLTFRERSIYAALLSGIHMETAIGQARELYQLNRNDSNRKLLMALSYDRLNDPDAARPYLEHINLGDLSPGQAAVLSGILAKIGIQQQALQIAAQIPENTPMLPEEKRYLLTVKL